MRAAVFVPLVAVLLAACGGAARSGLHVVRAPGSDFPMRCDPTRRATVAVVGAVARPVEASLEGAPTLGAALSAAGGATKDARSVRVYLCAPSGEGSVLVGDVRALDEDDARVRLGPGWALVMVGLEDD